jgi:hypothetical protein
MCIRFNAMLFTSLNGSFKIMVGSIINFVIMMGSNTFTPINSIQNGVQLRIMALKESAKYDASLHVPVKEGSYIDTSG